MDTARADSGLPRIGEIVDSKYVLESLLGQGGMGAVFRATHAHTGRTVALKVIVPALAADESFLRRFEREARAAGGLRHPNIVDVTDFGYAATPRGRLAYLVMEFLDGCSLADVLRQQAGFPLAWSVDVLEQIGSAVEEAHRAGLLHRDLKPDNIWLEPNRKGGYTVKVLDFGLAKLAGQTDDHVSRGPSPLVSGPLEAAALAGDEEATRVRAVPSKPPNGEEQATLVRVDESAATTVRPPESVAASRLGEHMESATAVGSVVGTPAYMSPEQCRGEALTPASDVYSLGVIAFRMLSGRLPFEGKGDQQIKAHVHETPPDLASLRKDLPADASALVMQALSKDPIARPRSAGAFASMLSARVQPTGDFLRSAVVLFIQHWTAFLEASILWLSPALAIVALFSLTAILEASGYRTFLPMLPATVGILAPQIISVFGIVALQGALVPAVMQAIVAPLQPVDLKTLRKVFRGRTRAFLRGVFPMVGFLIAYFVWVLGVVLILPPLIQPYRVYLRALPRPLAFAVVALFVMPVAVGPLFFFRTSSVGSSTQFLGSVAMMEGRFGKDAIERSRILARASDRALKAVRVVTMSIGGGFGIVLGMLTAAIPRGLPEWAPAAIQGPVTAIGLVLLAPFLAVVSALTYLRALKAAGESPDDVLRRFEREILPPSHWKLAARERILTQIDATRG